MSVKGAYRQDDSIGPLEGLFSLLPGHIPETMFFHPKAPPPKNGRRQRAAATKRQKPRCDSSGGLLVDPVGSVLFRFLFSPRARSSLQDCGVSPHHSNVVATDTVRVAGWQRVSGASCMKGNLMSTGETSKTGENGRKARSVW